MAFRPFPRRPTSLPRLALGALAQDLAGRLRGRSKLERERAAGRALAHGLGRRGGLYAKLGQYLAMRVDLFPDAFREELAGLHEDAPARPYGEIRAQLELSLGPLGSVFSYIDPKPLGTASIAQVHRARRVHGGIVAVKVRHAHLTPASIRRDVRSLRRASFWLRAWIPKAVIGPLLDALGESLERELDFELEAQVAEEIAENLSGDPRIVVPGVHWDACGPGVLTLDYVPRIRLDGPALAGEREACLAILCEAYGRQVFAHGLFHADPHPGNVFLVDESDPLAPDGHGPRLLFLDFGLAQRLEPELREELRTGIHALLRRDVDGLFEGLARIGAIIPGAEPAARKALQEALECGAAGALGSDAGGIDELKQLGKRLVRESGAFRIPSELLLYARTLAYVLGLAATVSPGSDPMRLMLPHILRFLSTPT